MIDNKLLWVKSVDNHIYNPNEKKVVSWVRSNEWNETHRSLRCAGPTRVHSYLRLSTELLLLYGGAPPQVNSSTNPLTAVCTRHTGQADGGAAAATLHRSLQIQELRSFLRSVLWYGTLLLPYLVPESWEWGSRFTLAGSGPSFHCRIRSRISQNCERKCV
jgi:hypothetical protein